MSRSCLSGRGAPGAAKRPTITALIVTSVLLLSTASCARTAQVAGAAEAPRPITWCAEPQANATWSRKLYYLELGEFDGPFAESIAAQSAEVPVAFPKDTMVTSWLLRDRPGDLPPALVATFLHDIGAHFRHETGLVASDTAKRTGRAIPAADARYAPPALGGYVSFDLLGSGKLDSVRYVDVVDSSLASDVVAALRAASAAGDLVYGDDSVRHHFAIFPGSIPEKAAWPAFTLSVPESHRIGRLITAIPPRYPDLSWNAQIDVVSLVDTSGYVVPGTMRALPPPDQLEWKSPRERVAYERFVSASESALLASQYAPAEVRGCKAATWVSMPYKYLIQPAVFARW